MGGSKPMSGERQTLCSGCAGQHGGGAAPATRLGTALPPYPTTGAAVDRHDVRRRS